jgi:hypothetical protein
VTELTTHGRIVAFALAVIAAMLGAGCAGSMPAATPAASDATASPTAAATQGLNGTYRYTLTQEDAEKAKDPEANIPGEYPQTITITLKDGELDGGCFGNAGGTYTVTGDRIAFYSREYDEGATVTFSRDGDGSLHFSPVPPFDHGVAFQCFSKPWTKIE